MLYVIMGRDAPGTLDLRLKTRPDHVAYLKQLVAQGRMVLAGPRPRVDAADPGAAGFHGSLIVAEFESLAAAQAWAQEDPYAQAGVFEHVDIYPFVKALP